MWNRKRKGKSYAKRVADVNQIYETYAKTGLPNREIWKRYIYPRYGIGERTFYNMLKAPTDHRLEDKAELADRMFYEFERAVRMAASAAEKHRGFSHSTCSPRESACLV